MASREDFDPQLIAQIESFLKSTRNADSQSAAIPSDVARARIEGFLTRAFELEGSVVEEALIQGIDTTPVPLEQASVENDELAKLATLLTRDMVSLGPNQFRDGGFDYSGAKPSDTSASLWLRDEHVPNFVNTDYFNFDAYRGNAIDFFPAVAHALGITRRPFTLLTVGMQMGALTDEPTREAMAHLIERAPDIGKVFFCDTEYYFYNNGQGKRVMGKIVTALPAFLGERIIQTEDVSMNFPGGTQALSRITAGDIALAKIGLISARKSVNEYRTAI